ncbi:MAG: transporter substrate-binding domain-containing protein [Eubacterium sp.]|nr:transporter substrate-binding domain-containing protein [Eubacterium sp.]
MKKIIAMLLMLTMVLGLAACGTQEEEAAAESADAAAEETADATETEEFDFTGLTVGVQLGTTGDIYVSDLETEGVCSVERYNKGTDAVQALITGKIDCVVIDEQPANAFVEKNEGLSIYPQEFALEEYAICVSKDNSELTEAINGALEELKADGTVDQIIANYIGDDTKGTCPYESPEDVDRSNGTLIMATNAAFEPYEFYDGTDIVGIDAELAQAICDKLGYELQIEDMEFDSIITAVQTGKADFGMAGMTVTEDRLKNIDFTDTYTTAKQVIIVAE